MAPEKCLYVSNSGGIIISLLTSDVQNQWPSILLILTHGGSEHLYSQLPDRRAETEEALSRAASAKSYPTTVPSCCLSAFAGSRLRVPLPFSPFDTVPLPGLGDMVSSFKMTPLLTNSSPSGTPLHIFMGCYWFVSFSFSFFPFNLFHSDIVWRDR